MDEELISHLALLSERQKWCQEDIMFFNRTLIVLGQLRIALFVIVWRDMDVYLESRIVQNAVEGFKKYCKDKESVQLAWRPTRLE